jgi:hypothetical protein
MTSLHDRTERLRQAVVPGWLAEAMPGWLLSPRSVERSAVAGVYYALADELHAIGTDRAGDVGPSRRSRAARRGSRHCPDRRYGRRYRTPTYPRSLPAGAALGARQPRWLSGWGPAR